MQNHHCGLAPVNNFRNNFRNNPRNNLRNNFRNNCNLQERHIWRNNGSMNFEPRYHRKKHTIYRKWARGFDCFDYFHHTQNRSGKSIRPPYVSLPVGAPGLSPSRVTEHEVDLSDKQIKNRNKRAAYKNRKRIGKRAKWADVRKNTYDLSKRNLYYHRNNRSINARRAHRRRSWRHYKSERLAQRAKQESKKLFKIHPSMHKRKIWSRVRNRIKVKAAVHRWYHL